MLIRHPLTLLTQAVPALTLTPGNSCILAQDVHAPFTDAESGYLASYARAKVLAREFDEYFDALELAAPCMATVLSASRELGFPVVYSVLGYHAPQPPSPFQRATGWTWDLDTDDGNFPAALAPQAGEPCFSKPGWGACGNPALVEHLHTQNIQNVVLFGSMFDFGIRQSAAELGDRGFQVLIVSDAVAALTSAGRAFTSGSLASGMTKLRSTGEMLDLWKLIEQHGQVLV